MLVMVGGLAVLGGVLTFVVATFVRGVPDLASQLTVSVGRGGRVADQRPAAAERSSSCAERRTSC